MLDDLAILLFWGFSTIALVFLYNSLWILYSCCHAFSDWIDKESICDYEDDQFMNVACGSLIKPILLEISLLLFFLLFPHNGYVVVMKGTNIVWQYFSNSLIIN